jgi:hypothetical protein
MGTFVARHSLAVFIALLTLAIGSAEQTTADQRLSSSATPPENGAPKTVEGCLTVSNGYYTLGTDTGDLYQLSGDYTSLRRYRGQTVRITGTVTTSKPSWSAARVLATQPPAIKVSQIKKVFDTCD